MESLEELEEFFEVFWQKKFLVIRENWYISKLFKGLFQYSFESLGAHSALQDPQLQIYKWR